MKLNDPSFALAALAFAFGCSSGSAEDCDADYQVCVDRCVMCGVTDDCEASCQNAIVTCRAAYEVGCGDEYEETKACALSASESCDLTPCIPVNTAFAACFEEYDERHPDPEPEPRYVSDEGVFDHEACLDHCVFCEIEEPGDCEAYCEGIDSTRSGYEMMGCEIPYIDAMNCLHRSESCDENALSTECLAQATDLANSCEFPS